MTRNQPTPNQARPTKQPKASRPLAILLTTLLLAGPLLAPSAAADNKTTKTVCTPGNPTDEDDPNPAGLYCATGLMETIVECDGFDDTYQCTVHARGTINATAPQACGSIDSNATNPSNSPLDRASVCVTLSDTLNAEFVKSETTGWKQTTYGHEEIGSQGLTVWYWVKVCSWIDRTDTAEPVPHCETYRHPDHLPPDPSAGGTTALTNRVAGLVSHTIEVVESAEAPVGLGE